MSEQVERWVLRPNWKKPRKVAGHFMISWEREWFFPEAGGSFRPRWTDDDPVKHRHLWEVFETEEEALDHLIKTAQIRWQRAQRTVDTWRAVEIKMTERRWPAPELPKRGCER